ncbi:hypothetical protein [Streptomyces werraensis]|uniref:hypothetical protein n=1 Tax=Streptomyces werraensis TaxID=68284 RepID=UPI0036F5E219
MSVEKRIEALVVRWLASELGIEAVTAQIDEDDWEVRRQWSGGCDTCGWEEETMLLTIWYGREGEKPTDNYVEVAKSPLTFLAELIRLEDSAT